MASTNKIAIIGAGSVGATIAYNLSIRGTANTIVLVDIDKTKAEAERMDIQQGNPLGRAVRVVAADYDACQDADVAVITAGAKQRPGESRVDLLARNASIARSMAASLRDSGFSGILFVVTNPVDVLTTIIREETGFEASRVIGSGTVLDTARLREFLAGYCDVSPINVHAYVLGEHGETSFPAWSLTRVGGLRADEFARFRGRDPEADDLFSVAAKSVRDSAGAIIAAKGSTFYAVAQAVAVMVEAVLRNENRILPVSVVDTYEGVSDVSFSYPTVVGAAGAVQRLPVVLSDDEKSALRRSVEFIAQNTKDARR